MKSSGVTALDNLPDVIVAFVLGDGEKSRCDVVYPRDVMAGWTEGSDDPPSGILEADGPLRMRSNMASASSVGSAVERPIPVGVVRGAVVDKNADNGK